MDILILTHSYPDEKNKWRGTFIKDQAKALSEIHDVTVVYFTVDNNRLAPFTNFSFSKNITGNLTEYSVTVPRSFPVINQVKYLFVTYKFISDHILNKKKIDIIHSHLSYPAGFLGTIIYKIKRIPNVITEHTWIRKYFRSPIHKICVKYALNNCSLIIAVSNALKTDIQNFSTNSISVVPNVVDIEMLMDNAMLALNYQQAAKYGVKYILSGTNMMTEGLSMPLKWWGPPWPCA